MKFSVFALLLMFSVNAFAISVGTVDIQKVMFNVKEGKKVATQLESTFKKKKSELQKERDDLMKEEKKFNKQSSVLSGDAKSKKREALQKKFVGLQEKSLKYQKEMQDMENKLKKPLVDRVRGIITDVSKSSKVDLTVTNAAMLLYAANEVDLTDKVIKAYDKKYPVKK